MLTASAARPTSTAVRIVLSRSSQISGVEMPMRMVPNSFSPSLPSSSRSLTSNVPSEEIACDLRPRVLAEQRLELRLRLEHLPLEHRRAVDDDDVARIDQRRVGDVARIAIDDSSSERRPLSLRSAA